MVLSDGRIVTEVGMSFVNSTKLESLCLPNGLVSRRLRRSAMLVVRSSCNDVNWVNPGAIAKCNSVHVFGRPSLLEDHKLPARNLSPKAVVAAEVPVTNDVNESHVVNYRVMFTQFIASDAVSLANAAAAAAQEAADLSREVNTLDKMLLEEQVTLNGDEQMENTYQEGSYIERLSTSNAAESLHGEHSGRTYDVLVESGRRPKRLKTRERAEKKALEVASEAESLGSCESSAEMLVREKRKRRPLTADEEITLAKGVQDLLAIEQAKTSFMERMHREPTLQEWAKAAGIDERIFHRRLWTGRMCKDKIVRCNLGLIAVIAKNYLDYGLPIDDLMQDGCLGLLRGIEKFDPSRGCKLSTYVYWWIKQAIGRAVAAKAKPVRLPVHYYEVLSKIKRIRRVLTEQHGRRATDQEVAEAAGVSISRMHAVMNWSGVVRSFDKPVGRNGDISLQVVAVTVICFSIKGRHASLLQEVTPDESPESCQSAMDLAWLKDDVEKTLKHLRPREAEVMRHRYGLNGNRAKTLEEIGAMYNVTRERIRQIEIRAMRKLQTPEVNKLLRLHLNSNSF